MNDLAERIRASIEDPNGEPWFPELTTELTKLAWDNLGREFGLTPSIYSTSRVIARNTWTPRHIVASLKVSSSCSAQTIAIEAVPLELVDSYRRAGVSFYSADRLPNTAILSCIEDALVIINQIPSLMMTIATLVGSLHVIAPEDTEHDVSFSEPWIPFSIFVSVPNARFVNDALRVAEAITHEAMHLQLTMIERLIPLVRPTGEKYFSPWRRTDRSPQGVLHGLYVFRVIDRFLVSLCSLGTLRAEVQEHIQRRHAEINRQISMIRSFESSSGLTLTGARFVQGLLGFPHQT